jgi:hypothetical protein
VSDILHGYKTDIEVNIVSALIRKKYKKKYLEHSINERGFENY